MKRALAAVLALAVAVALLYVSRFWPAELWTRGSLLGELGLRPQGDMVRFWLRGTSFATFDLIVWAVGVFLVLSWTDKLLRLLTNRRP